MMEATRVVVMDRELLDASRMSVLNLFPEYAEKVILFSRLTGKDEDVDDRGEHATEIDYRSTVEHIERVLLEGLDQLLFEVGSSV